MSHVGPVVHTSQNQQMWLCIRVILFIMYDGVMLLLCNYYVIYYVRMREFIFIRVVIGYS